MARDWLRGRQPAPWAGGVTTIERTVAARRGQDWFRATLIAGFDGTLRKNANEFLQQALVRFHGQPLRLPQRFAPDPNLLRQHRAARFMG